MRPFTSLKEYNKKKLKQSNKTKLQQSNKKKVMAKTKYAKNKVGQESKSDSGTVKRRWKPYSINKKSNKGNKKRPAHDFSKEREQKRKEIKFTKGNWKPLIKSKNKVKRRRKPPAATNGGGGGYYSHPHQV